MEATAEAAAAAATGAEFALTEQEEAIFEVLLETLRREGWGAQREAAGAGEGQEDAEEGAEGQRQRKKTRKEEAGEGSSLSSTAASSLVAGSASQGGQQLQEPEEDESREETVVRVAGGWVRDKLLGVGSPHDIDVALNNISGELFANAVNECLRARNEDVHTVGVVHSNPSQSKHLETAKVRVLGTELDCVNLRSETYSQDNRIPEMQFGTPLEDALRRDFTINSLFYNVNEGAIEDFTGRGRDDLRRGLVCTPLAARETFVDDPLRVMRAVRFAARYNFDMHCDVVDAASSPEIHAALEQKVSRPRIGIELDGCLKGQNPRPRLAIGFLSGMGLFDIVFALPQPLTHAPEARAEQELELEQEEAEADVGGSEGARRRERDAMMAVEYCNRVLCATARPEWEQEIVEAAQERRPVPLTQERQLSVFPEPMHRTLFLATLLLPLRHLQFKIKKRPEPVSKYVILESIKFPGKDANNVLAIHACVSQLRALVRAHRRSGDAYSRVSLGLFVREVRELWPICIDAACVLELCSASVGARGPVDGEQDRKVDDDGEAMETTEARSVLADWTASPFVAGTAPTVPPAPPVQVQDPEHDGGGTNGLRPNLPQECVLTTAEVASIAAFQDLKAHIRALGLDRVWEMRPILDGKQVTQELSLPKGPITGQVIQEQIRWQLGNDDLVRSGDMAAIRVALLGHLRAFVRQAQEESTGTT